MLTEDSIFSEEFLDSLPTNPFDAIGAFCGRFREYVGTMTADRRVENHLYFVEAMAVIWAYCESQCIEIKMPRILGNATANVVNITDAIDQLEEEINQKRVSMMFSVARKKAAKRFGGIFVYELSEGDLERIQELLNQLRDLIAATEDLSEGHKSRLIEKIEALQSELHKKMTSLDKFWGLVGEMGILVGKLHKNAKPYAELISSILKIVWAVQGRAEELQSGLPIPQLPSGSDCDD